MTLPEINSKETYHAFIAQINTKAQELSASLPTEVRNHSTTAGITALARAACYCTEERFNEVFTQTYQAVNNKKDPQPLDQFLVNGIWLELTANQEKELSGGHLTVKTAVLSFLLREHFVVEANPSITCGELYDALIKRWQEDNYNPELPRFTHNLLEQYGEPPYHFLMAKIQFLQNQELLNYYL